MKSDKPVPTNNIPDDAQSIKQVADLLGIQPVQICQWIDAGKLKSYMRERGKCLLVSLGATLRLMEKESPKPTKKEPGHPLPINLDDLASSDLIPSDLISVKEAARLVCNTHVGTIRRWIKKGKLPGYTIGSYFKVSRADVLGLIRPYEKPTLPPTRREMTQRQKRANRILAERGML